MESRLMKQIDEEKLTRLARAVADTANTEIDCEGFLVRAAAYLENRRNSGATLSPELKAVEQHLKVCPECYEEFQILKRAIE